jgi:urease alpha subunit
MPLQRRAVPIRDTRTTFKTAMRYNAATPLVQVDPRTHDVTIDGQLVDIPPAETLPLTTRYFVA